MTKEETDTQKILFLAQRYKLWNLKNEGEYDTFYDPLQKRIIFLQSTNVYAFERYDRVKDSNPIYFLLPSKYKNVDALAISHDDRYIIIQDGLLKVAFIDFGPMLIGQAIQQKDMETKERIIEFQKNKVRILSFSFIKSNYFDFVICFSTGFDIYKYDTGKRQINKPIKSISYNTLNVWINPLESLIIMSSSKTKGEIQTYHIKRDDIKLKKIKGPTFNLILLFFTK